MYDDRRALNAYAIGVRLVFVVGGLLLLVGGIVSGDPIVIGLGVVLTVAAAVRLAIFVGRSGTRWA